MRQGPGVENTKCLTNNVPVLDRCRGRWANINPALAKRCVFGRGVVFSKAARHAKVHCPFPSPHTPHPPPPSNPPSPPPTHKDSLYREPLWPRCSNFQFL